MRFFFELYSLFCFENFDEFFFLGICLLCNLLFSHFEVYFGVLFLDYGIFRGLYSFFDFVENFFESIDNLEEFLELLLIDFLALPRLPLFFFVTIKEHHIFLKLHSSLQNF